MLDRYLLGVFTILVALAVVSFGIYMMLYGGGLLTFCTEEEFVQTVKEFNGTDEELVIYFTERCANFTHPSDGCLTFGGGVLDNNTFFLECYSKCDGNGTALWSGIFNRSTRDSVSDVLLSVYPICANETTTTTSTSSTTMTTSTTTTTIPKRPFYYGWGPYLILIIVSVVIVIFLLKRRKK